MVVAAAVEVSRHARMKDEHRMCIKVLVCSRIAIMLQHVGKLVESRIQDWAMNLTEDLVDS